MFGFFKKKKQEDGLSEEEKAIYAIGEKMLEQLGAYDYLNNLAIRLCCNAHEIHPVEVYGHINACIGIGAAGMVSSLSQIAVWQLEKIDSAEEVVEQFRQLALQSSTDALEWIRENDKVKELIH